MKIFNFFFCFLIINSFVAYNSFAFDELGNEVIDKRVVKELDGMGEKTDINKQDNVKAENSVKTSSSENRDDKLQQTKYDEQLKEYNKQFENEKIVKSEEEQNIVDIYNDNFGKKDYEVNEKEEVVKNNNDLNQSAALILNTENKKAGNDAKNNESQISLNNSNSEKILSVEEDNLKEDIENNKLANRFYIGLFGNIMEPIFGVTAGYGGFRFMYTNINHEREVKTDYLSFTGGTILKSRNKGNEFLFAYDLSLYRSSFMRFYLSLGYVRGEHRKVIEAEGYGANLVINGVDYRLDGYYKLYTKTKRMISALYLGAGFDFNITDNFGLFTTAGIMLNNQDYKIVGSDIRSDSVPYIEGGYYNSLNRYLDGAYERALYKITAGLFYRF